MFKFLSFFMGMTIIVCSLPVHADDELDVVCKVGEEVGKNYEIFESEQSLAFNYKANLSKGIKGAWGNTSSTYSSKIDQLDWDITISLIESEITRSPLIEISLAGKDRVTKKFLTETWTARGSISDFVEIYPLLAHRGISAKCTSKKFKQFLKQQ